MARSNRLSQTSPGNSVLPIECDFSVRSNTNACARSTMQRMFSYCRPVPRACPIRCWKEWQRASRASPRTSPDRVTCCRPGAAHWLHSTTLMRWRMSSHARISSASSLLRRSALQSSMTIHCATTSAWCGQCAACANGVMVSSAVACSRSFMLRSSRGSSLAKGRGPGDRLFERLLPA